MRASVLTGTTDWSYVLIEQCCEEMWILCMHVTYRCFSFAWSMKPTCLCRLCAQTLDVCFLSSHPFDPRKRVGSKVQINHKASNVKHQTSKPKHHNKSNDHRGPSVKGSDQCMSLFERAWGCSRHCWGQHMRPAPLLIPATYSSFGSYYSQRWIGLWQW